MSGPVVPRSAGVADAAGSCSLWVFEVDAGARRFYESLGGRLVDRGRETYGKDRVPIVTYAWTPIDALRTAAPEDVAPEDVAPEDGAWGDGP